MGDNPSRFKGPDLPVESVSWHEAMAFCEKLTQREREAGRLPEGYEYTLPTEAQWEYACRAGTTTRFSFGDSDSDLGDYGWYGGNSSYTTHPVGEKLANPWGLYDMHGNVQEWCRDWYGNYPGERSRIRRVPSQARCGTFGAATTAATPGAAGRRTAKQPGQTSRSAASDSA